jgi:hypothetical protein
MLFPNSVRVFEDLDKEDMVNRKKRGKKRGKGMLEHRGGGFIGGCQR